VTETLGDKENAMDVRRRLEASIGGVWHSVSFFHDMPECPQGIFKAQGIRFCEAIVVARVHKVLIDPIAIACPGARFAFGSGNDLSEEMIQKLGEKGYSHNYVRKMIKEIPRLKDPPAAVGLNMGNPPDIIMAALQPDQAMRLVQLYEKEEEKALSVNFSSVMSICANVAVRALQTEDATLSFGCEDARVFGGISRDRLVAGVPYSMAQSWVGISDVTQARMDILEGLQTKPNVFSPAASRPSC
jgi:uncharacterized protein (DUF169 family)